MKHVDCFLLVSSIMISGCITTNIPQVIIPEKTGIADFSVGFGTSGAQMNGMYTTKFGMGLMAGLGTVGNSDHAEVSLAFVQPKHFMISTGFGNANFRTHPLIYGGTRGIYDYWGYFSSMSVRANIQVFESVGWINSLLIIYGKENGDCNLICNRYNTHHFRGYLYESVFYFRGKKHRNLYYMLHGSRLLGKGLYPKPPDERVFSISNLHLALGVHFPARSRSPEN